MWLFMHSPTDSSRRSSSSGVVDRILARGGHDQPAPGPQDRDVKDHGRHTAVDRRLPAARSRRVLEKAASVTARDTERQMSRDLSLMILTSRTGWQAPHEWAGSMCAFLRLAPKEVANRRSVPRSVPSVAGGR